MTPLHSNRPPKGFTRSDCPVACSLEILGDKWTLLVIRDLFVGARRYADFLASPEKIPTNILAERLKRLESFGLVVRQAYLQKPLRYEYELTEAGKDLRGVLKGVAEWGNRHLPGTTRKWKQRD